MTITDLRAIKLYASRTDFVRSFFSDKKGKVLDVGNLGEGPINVDIRSMIEPAGGEYWGLDVNKNLAVKLGFTKQLTGDLHDAPEVQSESFDYIYGGEIIEHTWRPGKMIDECWRILKPGGYLILDTPNAYDLTQVLRAWLKKVDTLGLDDRKLTYNEAKDNFQHMRETQGEVSTQPQHKIFFSPAMMRQLLWMHGFEIERFAYIGKAPNPLVRFLTRFIPQGAQKLGVIARKSTLDNIFSDVR